jgi:hypothetical protein
MLLSRPALSIIALLCLGNTSPVPGIDDTAALKKWEYDAVAADLAGDANFYAANLVEDWTGGMSNGAFQTKAMLVADLRDPKRNITLAETITEPRVRLYGDVAVTTYTETYDALIHGERRAKTIITTDTFIKRNGRWLQASAHSSAGPVAP